MVFLILLGFPVFKMIAIFLTIVQAGVSKPYCFTIETDIPLSLWFIQCILKKAIKMSKLLIASKVDQFSLQVCKFEILKWWCSERTVEMFHLASCWSRDGFR